MTEFVQFTASGLTLAALYALVAVGWSLGWGVARFLNLMIGEYYVLAAVAFGTMYRSGTGFAVAAAAALAISLGAGAVTEGALRATGARDVQASLIVTLALAMATHDIAALVWGRESIVVGSFLSGPPLELGGAFITRQALLVVAVAGVVLVAAGWGLQRTRFGTAMRACAEDPVGAMWCGIRADRTRATTILFSALVAGVAGILFVPLAAVNVTAGIPVAIKGLIAAILGGLGSMSGAVVGAVVVGLAEAYIAGYLTSERAGGVLYIGLVVLLLVAPSGVVAAVRQVRLRWAAS